MTKAEAWQAGKEDASLATDLVCDLIVEGLIQPEKAEEARGRIFRTLYKRRHDRGEMPTHPGLLGERA